jgi:hypothetical protein
MNANAFGTANAVLEVRLAAPAQTFHRKRQQEAYRLHRGQQPGAAYQQV